MLSDGLIKEYEIAKANDLLLLPVGATEYATREIYSTLIKEGYFDSPEFPAKARKYIDQLGDVNADLSTIKNSVIDLLKSLK